jgi:hypothetical protein
MSPKRKRDFAKIFGKLTWRFTRTNMYSEYEGMKKVTPYKIIASDGDSVVLKWIEDNGGEDLQQINFEGANRFHVISGWNVEFFRRIDT